jgi:hypothetical protein
MFNHSPPLNNKQFLQLINEAHRDSGRTLREVGDMCNIHYSHVERILKGTRKPKRDLLIILCWNGWNLETEEGDEIIKAGGYKTLFDWKKAGWEEDLSTKDN